MRTGRLPAQRLGIGTLVNSRLTAGRRIMYFTTTTSGTNDQGNLTIADTSTYMSTVYFAMGMGMLDSSPNATGSIGAFYINTITGGSVAFKSGDTTLKHKARLSVLIIGSPDATYIVD